MVQIKKRPIRLNKIKYLIDQIPIQGGEREKIIDSLSKTIKKPKIGQQDKNKKMEKSIMKTIKQISRHYRGPGKVSRGYVPNGQRRNAQPIKKPAPPTQGKLKIEIDHLLKVALVDTEAAKQLLQMFMKKTQKDQQPETNSQIDQELDDPEEEIKENMIKPPGQKEQHKREAAQYNEIQYPPPLSRSKSVTSGTNYNPYKGVQYQKQRIKEIPTQEQDVGTQMKVIAQRNPAYQTYDKEFYQKLGFASRPKALDFIRVYQSEGTHAGVNEDEQVWKDRLRSIRIKYQGKGICGEGEALTNYDIDDIMENQDNYIGTYALDEIDEAIDKVKKLKLHRFSFIVNTDSTKDFQKNKNLVGHWIAVWCDTQLGDFFIYDCLGMNPKNLIDQLKQKFGKYFDKTETHHLKFKTNDVQEQPDYSYMCGWYAIRAINMLNQGLSWKVVTGFNNMKENEKDVKGLEKRYDEFGYI